jgi:hypothetical protein
MIKFLMLNYMNDTGFVKCEVAAAAHELFIGGNVRYGYDRL